MYNCDVHVRFQSGYYNLPPIQLFFADHILYWFQIGDIDELVFIFWRASLQRTSIEWSHIIQAIQVRFIVVRYTTIT